MSGKFRNVNLSIRQSGILAFQALCCSNMHAWQSLRNFLQVISLIQWCSFTLDINWLGGGLDWISNVCHALPWCAMLKMYHVWELIIQV